MADHDLVGKWLVRLGSVVATSIPDAQADEWVSNIGPLLAERFGDDAFTFQSLEHVASESKFLPNYAELVERLRAWRSSIAIAPSDVPRIGREAAAPYNPIACTPPQQQRQWKLRHSGNDDVDPEENDRQDKAARISAREQIAWCLAEAAKDAHRAPRHELVASE